MRDGSTAQCGFNEWSGAANMKSAQARWRDLSFATLVARLSSKGSFSQAYGTTRGRKPGNQHFERLVTVQVSNNQA